MHTDSAVCNIATPAVTIWLRNEYTTHSAMRDCGICFLLDLMDDFLAVNAPKRLDHTYSILHCSLLL